MERRHYETRGASGSFPTERGSSPPSDTHAGAPAPVPREFARRVRPGRRPRAPTGGPTPTSGGPSAAAVASPQATADSGQVAAQPSWPVTRPVRAARLVLPPGAEVTLLMVTDAGPLPVTVAAEAAPHAGLERS